MKIRFIYLIFLIPFITFSCDEKEKDKPQNVLETPVIAEFGFENPTEITAWSIEQSDSSTVLFDSIIKYRGAGSLKIANGCSRIIYNDFINIKKENSYRISMQIKNQGFPNEAHPCGFAYNLAFVVVQDNEFEFYSIYKDTEQWHKESFFFFSGDSGSPIQFKILSGEQNVWIDDLLIEVI